MNLPELAPLLDDFFETTGLPCMIFTRDCRPLYELEALHGATVSEYYQAVILDFTLQKRDALHPLLLIFEPDYFFGVAQLTEDVFLCTALVGPFAKDRAKLMQLCSASTEPKLLVRFCDFLASLPQFTLRKFVRAFSLLVYLCTENYIPPSDILLSNTPVYTMQDEAEERELFTIREELAWHTDVDFEAGICAAIEAGDPELLKVRLAAPQNGRAGQMSLNPVTQAKYVFVSFTSLVTRAAIRGGLNQETAYSLSDVYCQQMDRITDTAAIEALSYKMAMEFARRVSEKNLARRYSPPVQKCVDHIVRHLHETIRLTSLSELCGLCTRNLSAKFRREVGMSVADYISQEKLREAQFLLKSSDYTLLEISSMLQFNSQSYFTKRFKETVGVTPQKYRDMKRNE